MSKIICDVCGTAYPDTASQCPICGCAAGGSENQSNEASVVENNDVERRSSARGGRFTKSNVRKRTTAQTHASRFTEEEDAETEEQSPQGSKAVTIAVIVLLIAVLLVAAYIAIRFFAPKPDNTDPSDTGASTSAEEIPCTDLHVDTENVTFRENGRAWLLNVTKLPGNTTDTVTYASSDEAVVTVTADGVLTSVGGGEATIIITCGSVTKEVSVLCDFEGGATGSTDGTAPSDDPTDPSTDATDPSTSGQMELNKEDVSCSYYGQKVQLKLKGSDGKTVVWTSEDEAIASVDENGKVTALSPGTVEIYAECEGEKFTCIIRCSDQVVSKAYTLNYNDVTIGVGESLTIRLLDASGKTVQDVVWTCSEPEYVELTGNKFTGLKPTAPVYYARIYTDYEGERYTCIVRVRNSD